TFKKRLPSPGLFSHSVWKPARALVSLSAVNAIPAAVFIARIRDRLNVYHLAKFAISSKDVLVVPLELVDVRSPPFTRKPAGVMSTRVKAWGSNDRAGSVP